MPLVRRCCALARQPLHPDAEFNQVDPERRRSHSCGLVVAEHIWPVSRVIQYSCGA